MGFYIDLILDVNSLQVSLPHQLDVHNYEVGLIKLSVPKTLNVAINCMQLIASFVQGQLYYDGKKTLYSLPVHAADKSKSLICEPSVVEYRPLSDVNLHEITFVLLDENNTVVKFYEGVILLVLHFKKRN